MHFQMKYWHFISIAGTPKWNGYSRGKWTLRIRKTRTRVKRRTRMTKTRRQRKQNQILWWSVAGRWSFQKRGRYAREYVCDKKCSFHSNLCQKYIVLISSGAKDRSEKVVRNRPYERIVEDLISCNVPSIVGRPNMNIWKRLNSKYNRISNCSNTDQF